MKVLVTGAFGFLGRHVVRELAGADHEVIALGRTVDGDGELFVHCAGVTVVYSDLADTAVLKRIFRDHRPSGVVHLAWFTEHRSYWSAPENLECLQQGCSLVRIAAEEGCERFVGAGSCAEYDWSFAQPDELTTPCVPSTLYGASKYSLFLVAERFCKTVGVSFAWPRYSFLFGEGEAPSRLVSLAIASLLRGQDFEVANGEDIRDFMHVVQAAAATAAILASNVEGAVNVGAGEPMPIKKIVEIIAASVGGAGGGRTAGAKPDSEAHVLVPSLGRLTHEVAWRPNRSVRHSLEDTVAASKSEAAE